MCSPLQTEDRPEASRRPCHTTPQPGVPARVRQAIHPRVSPCGTRQRRTHHRACPGVRALREDFGGHTLHTCRTRTNEWPVSITQEGASSPPFPPDDKDTDISQPGLDQRQADPPSLASHQRHATPANNPKQALTYRAATGTRHAPGTFPAAAAGATFLRGGIPRG